MDRLGDFEPFLFAISYSSKNVEKLKELLINSLFFLPLSLSKKKWHKYFFYLFSFLLRSMHSWRRGGGECSVIAVGEVWTFIAFLLVYSARKPILPLCVSKFEKYISVVLKNRKSQVGWIFYTLQRFFWSICIPLKHRAIKKWGVLEFKNPIFK